MLHVLGPESALTQLHNVLETEAGQRQELRRQELRTEPPSFIRCLSREAYAHRLDIWVAPDRTGLGIDCMIL